MRETAKLVLSTLLGAATGSGGGLLYAHLRHELDAEHPEILALDIGVGTSFGAAAALALHMGIREIIRHYHARQVPVHPQLMGNGMGLRELFFDRMSRSFRYASEQLRDLADSVGERMTIVSTVVWEHILRRAEEPLVPELSQPEQDGVQAIIQSPPGHRRRRTIQGNMSTPSDKVMPQRD